MAVGKMKTSPDRFSFVITGKIKPYVRMTARGKYVKRQAQEYLASKGSISLQFAEQMIHAGMQTFDKADKLGITAVIVRHEQRGDIDNIAKAILDAGNGVVYSDDRQLRKMDITLVDDKKREPSAQIFFEILS